MKRYLLTILIFSSVSFSNGQAGDPKIENNYIEVTGYSEMQVIPDEIYIGITIRERYDGREKITIDSIEKDLKAKLAKLGIDPKNLTLSDANSDFVKVQWAKKNVLTTKDYDLKVATASEVSKVYEELSEIKIQDLRIDKVNHSKMEDFKKEVKINAIKDGKEKATYLLSAIGSQIGNPIRITEQIGSRTSDYYIDGIAVRGMTNIVSTSQTKIADEITFSKIKIEYGIIARFEIR